MPSFQYRALKADGSYTSGRIDALSEADARQKLRNTGLNPVSLKSRASHDSASSNREARAGIKKVDLDKLKMGRAKADKVALAFLEKLHQLIVNGLPLGDAVKSLSQRLTEPVLHAIAGELWRDLSEGATLAEALGHRPVIFDPSLAPMIDVGEATGNLGPILGNINDLLRSRINLRKNIMAGLSYPAFILIVVFFVLLFVLFYLMPRIQEMLDSMGADLSLAAKMVMFFAHSTITYGPFVLGAAGIGALILQQWRKTDDGRLSTDRGLLRLPIVREIVLNAELSRLANLAAILLGSGVDATDALRLLERGFKNEELRSRFRTSRSLINDGASFSDAFHEQGILLEMDADVLSISENTGNLATGFNSIHRNRYERLEEQMKRLTVVLSTSALFFVFILVFLLVFGVVSSIMQLSSSIIGG